MAGNLTGPRRRGVIHTCSGLGEDKEVKTGHRVQDMAGGVFVGSVEL